MNIEKLIDEVKQLSDQIDKNVYEMGKLMNAIKEAEGEEVMEKVFKEQLEEYPQEVKQLIEEMVRNAMSLQ